MEISDPVATKQASSGIAIAVVLAPTDPSGVVQVSREGADEAVPARLAASLGSRPAAGDRILVAGPDDPELFVLAILERAPWNEPGPERLETAAGARAEVVDTAKDSSIRVFSTRGELLFDYDPLADRARVCSAAKDLEFEARGSISFKSGGTVEITARRGRVAIDDMQYAGKRLVAVLERSKLLVGRLETVARTVVTRARDVYRKVTGLTQTRTGRMRTLVDSTYHLKADKVRLKSKKDFKVDGERILLG